ncbi:hypothetical protein Tco_1141110 [Tanacetum coccineum]
MHNMGKTIGELHALLIEYEKGLSKKAVTPQGKDKLVYIPKPKNPIPSTKEHLAKDDACHHCKEVGNWKRNYPVYLAELIKKKKQVGTTCSSGFFTIELFSYPNKSWVYDTGCGTHTCNTKHGLRGVRRLKQGAIYLYVGNGVHAQVEAIGSFELILPNGPVICLEIVIMHLLLLDVLFQFLIWLTMVLSNVLRIMVFQFQRMMDYALESGTRILNMVPNKKVDKTPYELWYGKVPNLSYLKVWGCEALVKRDTPDKIQQISIKCIFVGYPKETMGYYFYFPLEYKIVVARYAEFLEKNLISQEVKGRAEELEEIQNEDTSPSKKTSEFLWRLKDLGTPLYVIVKS